MNMNVPQTGSKNVLSIILAVAALLLVVAVVAQWNLPFITGSRGALIALGILGVVMCAAGGLSTKVGRSGFSWASHFVIIGILLGVAAAYVLFAGLSGRALPYVSGEYGAFLALSLIIVTKIVVSRLHNWRLA
jgi:uncharacterized membrane protein